MTIYSIVRIDTVKFSLHGNEGMFQLPDTTLVNVISPHGEILDSYQNRKCLEGEFGAHNLHLRALHRGRELSVEGSPYAYRYGQNLYTSNDLLGVTRDVLPDVLEQCVNKPSDSDIQRWCAGDIALQRIDLYANFPCPEGVTPKRFIRQIARQLIERGVATRTHGSTFTWAPDGGRKYEIVFYAKGPQMRAKRSLANFPERSRLLREADNIVRVELRLHGEMLRDLKKQLKLDLDVASAWTQEMPRKIFGRFMKKLGIVNVTAGAVSDEELATLPSNRLKPVLALHKAGYDLRQIYSPATVQRHLHTFRKLGIDLRCPNQPECDFLPLPKLLNPTIAIRRAPKWLRRKGYAPSDS
jgi:II/X family phage/plasmid replication protein